MNRAWLKPFALGAAAVCIASVGTWIAVQNANASKILVVEYTKLQGNRGPVLPADPAPQFGEPSQYIVWIARRCSLQDWQIHSDVVLDSPTAARLIVPWREVTDASFNCLTQFITPYRVTMQFKRI